MAEVPVLDRVNPIIHLVRGLPGSGKTTYAHSLGCMVFAPSDMMSMKGGVYKWVKGNYMISKMQFREGIRHFMGLQIDIAVTEIMPEIKFINFWLNLAKEYYYVVHIKTMLVDTEVSESRNIHGADHKSIQEVHAQFDYSIRDQIIDYSETGIDSYATIKTYDVYGCAVRAFLNKEYDGCNTVEDVMNNHKFRWEMSRD